MPLRPRVELQHVGSQVIAPDAEIGGLERKLEASLAQRELRGKPRALRHLLFEPLAGLLIGEVGEGPDHRVGVLCAGQRQIGGQQLAVGPNEIRLHAPGLQPAATKPQFAFDPRHRVDERQQGRADEGFERPAGHLGEEGIGEKDDARGVEQGGALVHLLDQPTIGPIGGLESRSSRGRPRRPRRRPPRRRGSRAMSAPPLRGGARDRQCADASPPACRLRQRPLRVTSHHRTSGILPVASFRHSTMQQRPARATRNRSPRGCRSAAGRAPALP
jgi:hypothetical protein